MKISRKSWHYKFIHWLFKMDIWWNPKTGTMEISTYIIMFLLTIILSPVKLLIIGVDKFADWVERNEFYIKFVD